MGSVRDDLEMRMPIARILLIDDFEPFRRFLHLMLEQDSELQIVGEASDGLEAVEKIEELQPDLVLLDIGLPRLNGIGIARRVRELAPHARILFLSQEFSFDMVQEAFRLGALGYVHKQRAADELQPAIKAVLSGRLFIGSGLNDSKSSERTTVQTQSRHEAVFCSDRAALLDSFTCFVSGAQKAGHATIVVATKSHLDELLLRLRAQGLPVDAAIERGSFVPLDVTEVLSLFMIEDMPDPVRFLRTATALIDRAANSAAGYPSRVAVCGECAPVLLAEGKVDAAIRLEQFWDQVAMAFKVDTLCVYASETLEHTDTGVFDSICAEHSAGCSR